MPTEAPVRRRRVRELPDQGDTPFEYVPPDLYVNRRPSLDEYDHSTTSLPGFPESDNYDEDSNP